MQRRSASIRNKPCDITTRSVSECEAGTWNLLAHASGCDGKPVAALSAVSTKAFVIVAWCFLVPLSGSTAAEPFELQLGPFLSKYCFDCHAGDDPAGDVDFEAIRKAGSLEKSFEVWGKVDSLLREHRMPPEDEKQPTAEERAAFHAWYQQTFVDSVEARPGTMRPRRLSATEYRNTMHSLFGFELEVNVMEAEQTIIEKSLVLKLLPTDPPGKSRYRNDTHSNPLSTQIWEQYSYLADFALEELFSGSQRETLESMAGPIGAGGFGQQNAEQLIRHFVPRAWRRPVPEEQMRPIIDPVLGVDDVVAATKRQIKIVLMSPQFIYRGLMMRGKPGQQPVDQFELAERLSYFLWADMPDAQLLQLAEAGKLSSVLHAQVRRMLDSPKADNLAADFAVQWLTLDEIEAVSDNPPYMVALKSQPIDFFRYLVADDRPLMELVDSKTTFANPLTRRFYIADSKQFGKYRRPSGIEIEIVPNSRLTLNETEGRGGLLTMPGVLAMNRGPILRGVWMLERIMGEHLPDPPADVGQVEANIPGQNLSFRERFAMHRENESCAVCHDKIDPLGFALEAYDDNGAFTKASDYGKQKKRKNAKPTEPIVTSGQLPTGERFADFDQLKQLLTTTQREPIVRNVVKQMLSYALCRKLEIYDQPTVESIVSEMLENDGTWRDLIHAIVDSLPFQETLIPAED